MVDMSCIIYFMTIEQTPGLYRTTEGKPTPESLPSGPYKYVYFGEDGNTVISSLSGNTREHRDLLDRSFDPDTDDAGQLNLNWVMSKNEIDQMVEENREFAQAKGYKLDFETYRLQLETNFSRTKIKVRADYGSSTLSYRKPNPITRSKFLNRLGELFPGAVISEEKMD